MQQLVERGELTRRDFIELAARTHSCLVQQLSHFALRAGRRVIRPSHATGEILELLGKPRRPAHVVLSPSGRATLEQLLLEALELRVERIDRRANTLALLDPGGIDSDHLEQRAESP